MAKYDKLITLDSLKTAITKLKEVISGKADKATTLSGYGISDSYTKSEVDTNISAKVSKAGDTMTGKLSVPQVETGSTASNYFQCRKFRGEGTADTYYHAIDFGYQNHNQVDFYEYGGRWNFWLCTSGKSTSVASCGFINSGGWNGNVKGNVTGSLTGNASTATKATQDSDGNTINTTYAKSANVYTKTEVDNLVNSAGGIVVSATAPSKTNVLWIDTGNGGIAKYYDTSSKSWTTVKAVWG